VLVSEEPNHNTLNTSVALTNISLLLVAFIQNETEICRYKGPALNLE